MTNEAVMIDTFVRGLVAGRQAKEERWDLAIKRHGCKRQCQWEGIRNIERYYIIYLRRKILVIVGDR